MLRRAFLSLPLLATAPPIPVGVIAHRAAHEHHPENSLEAVRAAIEMGVHWVELDVRTAPDGTLVLKHDALTPDDNNLARFDDALDLLAASKIVHLYLDWKSATPEAIAKTLQRHNMVGRANVYASVEKLTALKAIEPSAHVMPEAVSADHLHKVIATLHPFTIAFDRRDFKEPIIDIARQAKLNIFVDCLGADDNKESWFNAIRLRATAIQTDKPSELQALLGYTKRG